ncbi:hypothetical protein AZI85_07825 [Bdellovibrio bacteriovorus]|uniref:Uncharacterized protein n=1 Tax=Bdellovibrio bacteriovorus TaxID=959 RepID=A0A150WG72_BDEBC|nr:hypothetical protein [Bdellovibrio bacteriovorus]KYG62098.1 hypothetical protein AZI85_07825 [Bdellovibrio bacteriovorus]
MKLIFAALIFAFSAQSFAQSLGETTRSIRARGMGGVLVPFVNDADALFVNPAALKRAAAIDIKLIELMAGANKTLVDSLDDLQNIDANDPSTFNDFYGKKLWAQGVGKAAISLPLISAGYLYDTEVTAELHNPAFPQFETYFRSDQAIYLGTAFSLGPSTYFGMSVKRITRQGGSTQELSISDIADSSSLSDIGDRFANKGQGYGADLAILHEIPLPILKPTLTLVWQDVGNTAFKKTEGDDAPVHIEQNLVFGAGVGMDLPGLDWVIGVEGRRLLNPEIEIGKKLHVGTEISLPLIDLRAGYNQGYLSYGVGVNFLIFHLDAVSYTEETGLYPGQDGDSRYMASLSIDLSFDANFKFTDNNGKRRKLKQRR